MEQSTSPAIQLRTAVKLDGRVDAILVDRDDDDDLSPLALNQPCDLDMSCGPGREAERLCHVLARAISLPQQSATPAREGDEGQWGPIARQVNSPTRDAHLAIRKPANLVDIPAHIF